MKKLLGILLIGILSACASSTTQPTAGVEDRSVNVGEDAANVEGQAVGSSGATFHSLQDPDNILSKRSIYYDFDSYVVANEYQGLVLAHAKFLRDNSTVSVLIQGNTDGRGSREYNLALGQRRADSVKNMMTLSGVREDQVESVSLGEEKPRGMGQNESSWTENRRADIIYRGE